MYYEITSNDGLGHAKCVTRTREDAARHWLCRFVRAAAKAQALLDRPTGVNAWSLACAWLKRDGDITLRVGTYTLTLAVEYDKGTGAQARRFVELGRRGANHNLQHPDRAEWLRLRDQLDPPAAPID